MALFSSYRSNHFVIHQLTRRAVLSRYRGTALGLVWSLLTPMLMLAIYTFVFGLVLEIRWPVQEGGQAQFAAILFSGMIVHSLLSDCLIQSTTLISDNPQYVKKVVFPLEALPWVTVLSALFQAGISLAVLILYLFGLYLFGGDHVFGWSVIFLPLPFIMLSIVCLGIGWFVSAAAVYFRDISQLMGVINTVLFFMAPILYPKSALPESIQFLLYLNPITFPIEQLRNFLLWNRAPDILGIGIYTTVALVFSYLGFLWFERVRKGFADVL